MMIAQLLALGLVAAPPPEPGPPTRRAASISASPSLDLSRLPAPAIVEPLDYEAIVGRMLDELSALDPALANLGEADPAVKVIQVAAYRELLLRQRANAACRAVLIAYATGADLDNLAAVFGVERLELAPADPARGLPATSENDDELRRRVLLAPEGYSVAGPAGAYRFHALSAHPSVRDVAAVSPAPGEVTIAILARGETGVPEPAALEAVDRSVNAETVRPLTDRVTVQAAVPVAFAISAILHVYAGPDAELVEAQARAALADMLDTQRRVGRDIARSAIIAALHVGSVHRVELLEPSEDVIVSPVEYAAPAAPVLAIAKSAE